MSKPVNLGSLKVGYNNVIDGELCFPGLFFSNSTIRRGSAKVRLVAIGIFDNVKRTMVGPADTNVEVPIIEKRSGQVVSISDTISLVDNECLYFR
jgi:translation initiation factor 5A